MKKLRILCAIGTRPEAVKMAPVVLALKREPWADVQVLATAQHREMLDQVLALFGIVPDIDLDIMRPNQSLPTLMGRLLVEVEPVLDDVRPDLVVVQGDTTTVLAVAMTSFLKRIPVAHVEAGLRTGDMEYPFPEEANRVLVGRLVTLHFAPTDAARRNLLSEGVPESRIVMTGNTVIDALLMVANSNPPLSVALDSGKRLVLVTVHRRENFGAPLRQICEALLESATRNPEVQFLIPVHPNPNVRSVIYDMLSSVPNVVLSPPLDYAPFVAAMQASYLVVTDSGGVQEEAPALGKPVLVLRDETERPEAVNEGVVKLVGPHRERLVEEIQRLLDDDSLYLAMSKGVSPYGDGDSANRIVKSIRKWAERLKASSQTPAS